jgi:dihydrofolate reductase
LLANNLIDRMHVWIYPVTVGGGKRLFAEGTQASMFRLTDSKVSETGAIIATYEPAGALKTGTHA